MNNYDPYEILEVPKGTSNIGELRSAYRRQISKYHPDRPKTLDALREKHPEKSNEELKELANDLTKKINDAWEKVRSLTIGKGPEKEHTQNEKEGNNSKTQNNSYSYENKFNISVNGMKDKFKGPFKNIDIETDGRFGFDRYGPNIMFAEKTTMRVDDDIIEIEDADLRSDFIVEITCIPGNAKLGEGNLIMGKVSVNNVECATYSLPDEEYLVFVDLIEACPNLLKNHRKQEQNFTPG